MILSAVPKIITDLNDGHEMGVLIDLGAAGANALASIGISAGIAALGIAGLPAAGIGIVIGLGISWAIDKKCTNMKKSFYGE